jgi:hypothetical protein
MYCGKDAHGIHVLKKIQFGENYKCTQKLTANELRTNNLQCASQIYNTRIFCALLKRNKYGKYYMFTKQLSKPAYLYKQLIIHVSTAITFSLRGKKTLY